MQRVTRNNINKGLIHGDYQETRGCGVNKRDRTIFGIVPRLGTPRDFLFFY